MGEIFGESDKAIYLSFMNDTATIRISKKVLRDLKAYLAPMDGKINKFVEAAIMHRIDLCKKASKEIQGK